MSIPTKRTDAKTPITRYDFESREDGGYISQDQYGDYVKYDDHAAELSEALSTVSRLRDDRDLEKNWRKDAEARAESSASRVAALQRVLGELVRLKDYKGWIRCTESTIEPDGEWMYARDLTAANERAWAAARSLIPDTEQQMQGNLSDGGTPLVDAFLAETAGERCEVAFSGLRRLARELERALGKPPVPSSQSAVVLAGREEAIELCAKVCEDEAEQLSQQGYGAIQAEWRASVFRQRSTAQTCANRIRALKSITDTPTQEEG